MMQRTRWMVSVCLLAVLAACNSSRPAEPAPSWSGVWVYDAALPPTAGGSPVTMRYELTVAEPGKSPAATMTIRGFQTDETLLGDVQVASSTLVVTFRSFGDGRTVNEFGVERYRPGSRLVTLSRESAQGMVTTEWEGLDPPAQTMPRKGVYFRARSSSEG
jgi:hypothetical protein